jgi:hypothetical protein
VKPALDQLDIDFTEISKENGLYDVKYFLQYYYYGGMIYATQKNFERSVYFFEVVLSTPAVCMSTIMSESFKKYVLVSLILRGTISPLPKYTSQIVMRHIRPRNYQYNELATAYSSNNIQEVSAVITRHLDTFNRVRYSGLDHFLSDTAVNKMLLNFILKSTIAGQQHGFGQTVREFTAQEKHPKVNQDLFDSFAVRHGGKDSIAKRRRGGKVYS